MNLYLSTKNKMNREKQVTMSLDLAKQMLGKDKAMDMLIKQNFSDEELEIKRKLLKEWENINCLSGYYIDANSNIKPVDTVAPYDKNKNILPTKKLAEAMLALCQLLYLRDIYNDGWEPNWDDSSENKYVISVFKNNLIKDYLTVSQTILSFESCELRNEFMINFKDLLEIAKPLL